MERVKRLEDIQVTPETIGEAGLESEALLMPEAMDEVFRNKDLTVREPFRLHYVVERDRDSGDVHIGIDIEGRIETFCSRCLETMTYPVDHHLETDYLPATREMSQNLEEERVSSETGYYRKTIHLASTSPRSWSWSCPEGSSATRGQGPLHGLRGQSQPRGVPLRGKARRSRLQKLAELQRKLRKE